MLELKTVADRCGLSEHQARRVVRALSPVLQDRLKRGKDNRILLDNSALMIVDRAVNLWRGGLPLQNVSQTVATEITNGAKTGADGLTDRLPNHEQPTHNHCTTCEAREDLVKELRTDKERLLRLLEDSQAQIRQLMLPPPKTGDSSPPPITRWQALRIALLGR